MSNKHSRHSTSSPITQQTSKLPKFFQKQSIRDRSKSSTDPSNGSVSPSSLGSSSSSPPETPVASSSSKVSHQSRKSSKLLGLKEKDERPSSTSSRQSSDMAAPAPTTTADNTNEMDEPPVIIEPVNIPRARTRSERPLSSASDIGHPSASLYASTPSTSRIGDLPTRLSGWFSHTFSSSSADLSLPALLSQSHLNSTAASPKTKTGSALLTAAKHGKGHLDKAVRYLLDSDATPDKCTEPIWILGVQHPGYEPPPPPPPNSRPSSNGPKPRRGSIDSRRHSPSSFRSSTSSTSSSTELSQTQSSSKHPGSYWPPVFYADFTSRIWLTYRSHFAPIRDIRLSELTCDTGEAVGITNSPPTKRWHWSVGAEKAWSSDAGWGCMLRTGQSLLANALLHLHLGRDWRRPAYPVYTTDYATYVQILTWFFDHPSPEAPFSVHRMALAGKELGTEVGQWFGPSIAAGAIKTLVNGFPEAGLGVSVATDGVVFQSDVYAASYDQIASSGRHVKNIWGGRPVLVLLGVRLGIDGVNPIYYDKIKILYTFPQSVGIAGGRPRSSYYFVGSQADSLFYLDPHHARPAIPLRPVPLPNSGGDRETSLDSDRERDDMDRPNQRSSNSNHCRVPTSPISVRTGSSTFSYHAPISPSPLQQQFSTSTNSSYSSQPPTHSQLRAVSKSAPNNSRWQPASQPSSPDVGSEMDQREFGFVSGGGNGGLDTVQEHYVTAYSAADMKTFHCDRVRKMPLSGLDPSMLLGFLCKDEMDWIDFRKRVADLPGNPMFTVQDEPPSWPSDSDDEMGLESISEPDDLDLDSDEQEGGDGEQFFDTRSGSASTSSVSQQEMDERGRKSEEVDTEEDPVDPITPGPGSKFEIGERPGKVVRESISVNGEFNGEEDGFDDDVEDDWVDPSMPTPTRVIQPTPPPLPPSKEEQPISSDGPVLSKSKSNSGKKERKGKKGAQVAVPVPAVKPSLVGMQQQQQQQHQQQQQSSRPQEHYPFPLTQETGEDVMWEVQDRPPSLSNAGPGLGVGGKRMHTARARDGGRTQSGGVRGVLTEG